ncbi:MAG: hypothetical protein JWM36_1797 [Hyphomicrobiales bacterium]|nr:hypothetical protein [Hyphomicrobiales bacterium]
MAPAVRPDATRPTGVERTRPDTAGQPLAPPAVAPNGRTDQRSAPVTGTQPGVAPLSPQGQRRDVPTDGARDQLRPDQRGGADRDPRDRFDNRADRPRVEERDGRTYTRENDNRVIIREGDREIIRHDETERLRRGARNVDIVDRPNGRREVVVVRPDGDRIVTLVDQDGNLLRRTRRGRDGRDFVLIDNERGRPSNGFYAPVVLPPLRLDIPRDRYIVEAEDSSYDVIEETLLAAPVERVERAYSLDEVRTNQRLREKVRRVDIDTITFPTGSAEIAPNEAARLDTIARAINGVIAKNPNEVFLVEGHTDAVGSDQENLTLSDRRAESVAAVLSERYQIPPENLVTQGYGEQYLKVQSQGPEQQNRRVTLRRITPLLQESQKR